MNDNELTQNERDALLRALQKALDDKAVPVEDRALVVRAKLKVEKMEVRRGPQRPPPDRSASGQRWE